jgi:hypothetical protein
VAHNPLAGGPSHIDALANKLMSVSGAYANPPPSGGEQFSVRLGENLIAHLDAIAKLADWTRSQVMTAAMNRGLFELYERLSPEVLDTIMSKVVSEVVPTMNTDSALTKEAKRIATEIAGKSCIGDHRGPDTFWVIGDRQKKGIPRMLVRVEPQASGDFTNARPSDIGPMTRKVRNLVEKKWAEAFKNPGIEMKLVISPESIVP